MADREGQRRAAEAVEILRGGLERHRDDAGKMCGCGGCQAMHGAIRVLRGEVVTTVEVVQVAQHSRDDDCAPYLDEHGECKRCGVLHSLKCPSCGGGGFHRPGCSEIG